jgi:hypothetical protein
LTAGPILVYRSSRVPGPHCFTSHPDRGRTWKEDSMARADGDDTTKYLLDERDVPTAWYNLQADLKTPLPPVLHPGTGQPIGPQDLAPLFPMELIKQEVSQDRWIEIPDQVRDVLCLWRPTPL